MSKSGPKPEITDSNENHFVKESYKPSPDMIRLTKLMEEKLTKYDDPEAESKVRKIMASVDNVSEDDAFFALHDQDYNVEAAIEHLKSIQEESQRSWKEVVKVAKKKSEPRAKVNPEPTRNRSVNQSFRGRGNASARGVRRINPRSQVTADSDDRRIRNRRGRGRANNSQAQRTDRSRFSKVDEVNSIENGEFDFVTEFEDWDGSLNESQVFVSSKLADHNVEWNEVTDSINFDDPFACMEQFDPTEVEERLLSGKGMVVESSVSNSSCPIDRLYENKIGNMKELSNTSISDTPAAVQSSKEAVCPVVMPPSSDSDDISNLGLQFGTWDLMSQKSTENSYANKSQRAATSQPAQYPNEMRYKQMSKTSQPMPYKESFANPQPANQMQMLNRQQQISRSSQQHPSPSYEEATNAANFMMNDSNHGSLMGNMKDHGHIPPHAQKNNLNSALPVSNLKHMSFTPGLLGPQSFVVSQPGMPFVPISIVPEYYADSTSWLDYCRNMNQLTGVSTATAGPIPTSSVSSDKRNGPPSNASFPPPGYGQPAYGYQYTANPNDANMAGSTFKVDKHQYHGQQPAPSPNFAFNAQQPQSYPCMPMCGPMTAFQDSSRPVSGSMTSATAVGVPKQAKYKSQGEWFNP